MLSSRTLSLLNLGKVEFVSLRFRRPQKMHFLDLEWEIPFEACKIVRLLIQESLNPAKPPTLQRVVNKNRLSPSLKSREKEKAEKLRKDPLLPSLSLNVSESDEVCCVENNVAAKDSN